MRYKIELEKRGDNEYLIIYRFTNLFIYKFWKAIDSHLIIDNTTVDYYCEKYNCHNN